MFCVTQALKEFLNQQNWVVGPLLKLQCPTMARSVDRRSPMTAGRARFVPLGHGPADSTGPAGWSTERQQ
jgi:hypothetical protein